MDPERGDVNVYELVTQLVRHTLRRHCSENGSSYVPPTSDDKRVKGFRSRIYEILLNKSSKTYNEGIWLLDERHRIKSFKCTLLIHNYRERSRF